MTKIKKKSNSKKGVQMLKIIKYVNYAVVFAGCVYVVLNY